MVGAMQTELRYERWFLPLSVPLGLGPKNSEVRIADRTLHMKMGWAFEAHIPVASITVPSPAMSARALPACTTQMAAGWSTVPAKDWWH
jgi:hypothetical protein